MDYLSHLIPEDFEADLSQNSDRTPVWIQEPKRGGRKKGKIIALFFRNLREVISWSTKWGRNNNNKRDDPGGWRDWVGSVSSCGCLGVPLILPTHPQLETEPRDWLASHCLLRKAKKIHTTNKGNINRRLVCEKFRAKDPRQNNDSALTFYWIGTLEQCSAWLC